MCVWVSKNAIHNGNSIPFCQLCLWCTDPVCLVVLCNICFWHVYVYDHRCRGRPSDTLTLRWLIIRYEIILHFVDYLFNSIFMILDEWYQYQHVFFLHDFIYLFYITCIFDVHSSLFCMCKLLYFYINICNTPYTCYNLFNKFRRSIFHFCKIFEKMLCSHGSRIFPIISHQISHHVS